MNMLIRWYYENRNKFWNTIIIVILILFFINILNNYYENKPKVSVANTNNTNVSGKETINNKIEGELESTTSLTTGESVNNKKLEKDIIIIDKFMTNCIEGKVEEAYELLTDECKEKNFVTLEKFQTNYYQKIFNNPKTYSVQNWSGNTYKVMIVDDALVTGKASSETYVQDYITIPDSNNEKLNINGYIGRKTKDKITTTDELEITYIKKETYMDYEEYTIKVKNLTNKEIILDQGKSTKNIYLLDNNKVKQYANTGEINYSNLLLVPGATKEYTFEFSNSYSKTRVMEFLIFENIIINNNYDDSTKLTIRL